MSQVTSVRPGAQAPGRAEPQKLRKHSPLYRRRSFAAWAFALPFMLLFLAFMAGPVLMSLAMAVTDLKSRDLRDPLAVNLVGVQNFIDVLNDPMFRKSAFNTAYFVLVGVPLTIVLALGIAVILNAGITKFTTAFRVGYYMPVITSMVAVAVVWRFLLQPDTGLVNEVLGLVGIEGPNWLNDTRWAMPSIIAMAVWHSIGTLIIIFLAGLQAVPTSLHEAAALDGATGWQRFRFITIPTVRPTILFGTVITSIGFLQLFEEPFVMTQGGPLNSTLSVSYYIYKQFGFGNYSYAAAMSYVLFIAIVVLTVLQFRLLSERDTPRKRRRAKPVPVARQEIGR